MKPTGQILLYIDGAKVACKSYTDKSQRQEIIDSFFTRKNRVEHRQAYYEIRPFEKNINQFGDLSPDQIKTIKETYKMGSSEFGTGALAYRFKVSRSMINWIVKQTA